MTYLHGAVGYEKPQAYDMLQCIMGIRDRLFRYGNSRSTQREKMRCSPGGLRAIAVPDVIEGPGLALFPVEGDGQAGDCHPSACRGNPTSVHQVWSKSDQKFGQQTRFLRRFSLHTDNPRWRLQKNLTQL